MMVLRVKVVTVVSIERKILPMTPGQLEGRMSLNGLDKYEGVFRDLGGRIRVSSASELQLLE